MWWLIRTWRQLSDRKQWESGVGMEIVLWERGTVEVLSHKFRTTGHEGEDGKISSH